MERELSENILATISLKTELKKWKSKYKDLEMQVDLLKAEIVGLSQSRFGSKGSGVILAKLVQKLNDLMMCPIGYMPIKSPVILKSGVTIDEQIFHQLKIDPYDKRKL